MKKLPYNFSEKYEEEELACRRRRWRLVGEETRGIVTTLPVQVPT